MDVDEKIIEEARSMGWVPEDEWNGDPEKWRPADEFVERGEKILPILRDRLNKTQEKLENIEKLLSTTTKTFEKQLIETQKQSYEKAQKEYNEQLAQLSKEGFEAAQEGDFDKWAEVEKKKQTLQEPKVEKTTVFDEWKKDNDWYEKDQAATSLAMGYAAGLDRDIKAGKVERMTEADFYKKVEEFVKSELPHKFKNPERDKPSPVETDGHESSQSKKKSWADLPKSAKEACSRIENELKAKGLPFSRDEWVKTYYEED